MNLLVGLVPLAIFLGVMIAGPVIASFRIHQEQNEELRRQKDLTRREREELLRQFAKERQGLEEERSRLLSQLDRKKENESLRGELNGLISEGNALIQLIVNTDGVRLPHLPDYVPPDELVKQVDDWTEKARAFVAKKVPWFEGTFSSDAGLFPANLVHGKHERFSELKEKVEHRLARLAQLLTQLS